ncbi:MULTISPECIES: TonB-dependent receptor [unclassified Sphingomonas]|uniref:TonB-dependent receptor n=1 Tax=unclassified Sphingomonas TaxID=196159 RepID=UPI0006FF73EC|nr:MULTISPECIES: TonB-dependent receptor [unclassified Sphingomonas]KQN21093.1 TonB-dependent receptor [Sphingomonas sp. Leaf30]MBD8550638.1 TonB-dependent receptor [Sphingomonas sp. CFBP 8764]
MIDPRHVALLAGTALATLAAPAFAQDTAAAPAVAPPKAATPAADTGEDVVVTARFRNESLQSVPIAITAVSGQSLAERQLNTVENIAATIPAVGFRSGASNKDRTIFIRGVGTITTSPGVEPSVSTVLDGVVLTRPGQSTLDLGEVERIEVLRGPQGTLFGKNASAGVVNIVTRNPTDEFRMFGEAGVTSDEEYRIKAGISGALVPGKVQALIGGLYDDFKGNVRNVTRNDDVNGYRRYGARGKLVITPSDALKFTIIGDYLNSRDTTPTSVYASTSRTAYPTGTVTNSPDLAAALTASGIGANASNRRTNNDTITDVRDENYGGSFTGDLTLGDYHLTSITGWRQWLNTQRQDYDSVAALSTAFPSGQDTGRVNTKQFSEELRLTSPKGGLIDYVLGAYYLHATTDETYQRTLTSLAAGGARSTTTGVANYGITNDNFALFGEANVNFTPRFRGIAGYRSTWDSLDFYHVRTSSADPLNTGAAALDRPGVRAYHNASDGLDRRGDSYRLGLQYDIGDHAQTYFTYSRGYKGPAYNVYFNMRSLNATTPLDEVPLSPETSNSYEVGLKGSTADRALSYSLAAFTTNFDGYQASFNDVVAGAQVSRLINAGSVRSRGAEADVTLRPTKGLTLDISAAYTDATVRNFLCPPGAPTSCNIDGQPLPYAPKIKLYENAAYRFALSDSLALELQSDVTFSSKVQYALAQTPSTVQPAYAIWNASVALLSDQSGWQLRAYVKNLTNTSYSSFLTAGTFAGTVRFVPRDDQRYAGLLLRKDF